MAEISVQIVLSALQTVGLLMGIFYYIMTLRNAEKTRQLTLESQQQTLEARQTQLFLQFYSVAFSKEFLEQMDYLAVEWSKPEEFIAIITSDPEVNHAWLMMARTYESIGVLLKNEYFNIKLLAQFDTFQTIGSWNYWKEVVYYTRKDYRRNWDHWEYLYDSLMQYLEEHPELAP